MADLDDFFAKKDRKKSKGKKFPTAEELSKKDDPKQKPDVRPKKDRPAQEGDETGRAGEEEEWKEYEETVKDYTGLKIQVLQGGNRAPDSGKDSASDDATSGEGGKNKGPWNKSSGQQQPSGPAEVEPVEEQPAPPPQPPAAKAAAAYVPPASRNRVSEPVSRRTQSRHAPDIHNQEYFPSLGSGGRARGGAAGGGGGGWSPAAAAHPAPAHQARAPLALGNRFTELQDHS